jgi:hypothetical protein
VTIGRSDTRLGEEVEDVPALLAQGHGYRQDSLDETAALCAVSPEAPLPIQHGGPDGPFRRVMPSSGLCRVEARGRLLCLWGVSLALENSA